MMMPSSRRRKRSPFLIRASICGESGVRADGRLRRHRRRPARCPPARRRRRSSPERFGGRPRPGEGCRSTWRRPFRDRRRTPLSAKGPIARIARPYSWRRADWSVDRSERGKRPAAGSRRSSGRRWGAWMTFSSQRLLTASGTPPTSSVDEEISHALVWRRRFMARATPSGTGRARRAVRSVCWCSARSWPGWWWSCWPTTRRPSWPLERG